MSSNKAAGTRQKLRSASTDFMLSLFNDEDGGDMLLRNVGLSMKYNALQPRRQ
jgi:hypothetical protein